MHGHTFYAIWISKTINWLRLDRKFCETFVFSTRVSDIKCTKNLGHFCCCRVCKFNDPLRALFHLFCFGHIPYNIINIYALYTLFIYQNWSGTRHDMKFTHIEVTRIVLSSSNNVRGKHRIRGSKQVTKSMTIVILQDFSLFWPLQCSHIKHCGCFLLGIFLDVYITWVKVTICVSFTNIYLPTHINEHNLMSEKN